MGYPVWNTPAGFLGKIAELEVYNYSFVADDPDGNDVAFSLIAGRLPPGIQLLPDGSIYGQPVNEIATLLGTPNAVGKDVDYQFTLRASNPHGQITDRTFSLTVTGNNPPQLLTGLGYAPPASLGSYIDGDEVSIQLSSIDLDINDSLTYRIVEGSLPSGLTMSSSGLISGLVLPYVDLPEGASTGWDESRWEEYPWQFSTRSVNKNYSFTVEVSDGKAIDLRKFIVYIYSHNLLRSDNSIITVDSELFFMDLTEKRTPVLLTKDLDGYNTFTSDNFFAFKFDGVDLDGDTVQYEMLSGSAASGFDTSGAYYDMALFDQGEFEALPGLTLNQDTGWLTGYIPPQIEPSKVYTFGIQVYKLEDPDYVSKIILYKLTVLGSLSLDINWITPQDLGSITAGSLSQLLIEAQNASGSQLGYTLKDGSKLPQGLKLLNDGSITGRCSFQSFSIDGGLCTFDVSLSERGFVGAPTKFDRTYTFTVIATNNAGSASSERIFTLAVDIRTPEPYENVYIRCTPDQTSRSKLFSILDNSDIFPTNLLYRSNDPFWGKRRDLTALIAYGITASKASDYIAAMQDRHYTKKFYFGDYGVSLAKDTDDNVIYEVVWVDLVEETRAYINGVVQPPPASSTDLSSKIVGWQASSSIKKADNTAVHGDSTKYDIDSNIIKPNDSVLMRRDLTDSLGITDPNTLPEWMTSIQKDGSVLGYVTKVPLAYVRPGEGDKVLFRLKKSAASGVIPDIKDIPFVVDRYILDSNMSQYFDYDTRKFQEHHYTTFDLTAKLPEQIIPIATVDFAVEIPFDSINGRTVSYIDDLGGLDGIVTSYIGKTIVFAKQEQYIGYSLDPETGGWEMIQQFFDDSSKFGYLDYAQEQQIPGYVEAGANPGEIENQRAGVWLITLDSNNLIKLVFQQEIPIASVTSSGTIKVNSGEKYGGNLIRYSIENQIPPKTVPDYAILDTEFTPVILGTTFDGATTRFLAGVDNYQLPDEGDKYLKFPKIGVFG